MKRTFFAGIRSMKALAALRYVAIAILAVLLSTVAAVAQVGTATVDGGEQVFSPVLSYEWNTDGDFEGWGTTNINNAAVLGGVMSGESLGDGSSPAGADPIFGGPGGLNFVIGSGAGEVNRLQFAAQFDAGAPTNRTEMFLFADGGGLGSQRWTPVDYPVITDGDLHTYTLDFDSTSPLWGATIATVRLDPVADDPNNVDTFAYDYLRFGSTIDPGNVPGDVDGDGNVNEADFELIRSNFFGINVGRSNGDLTEDGVVDLADFGQWKDNFSGSTAGFLQQLVGVPEPSAIGMAVIGIALMGAYRQRLGQAARSE